MLAHAGRVEPLVALGVAWMTAFAVAVREVRRRVRAGPLRPPPAAVPAAPAALIVAAAGLVLFGLAFGWR